MVVGGDVGVGHGLVAAGAQFTRGGGQADVHGLRVASQHFAPAAPGRAVALVDDDHAEGVFTVVAAQEAGQFGIGRVVVQPQGLVGGDVHARVARGVFAALRFDAARGVAEGGGELAQGLRAQLVAVAQKERGLGQQARLAEAPQQVGGDHGLAGASGQGQQHTRGLAGLLATQHLFQRGADGGVLVVAAGECGAVGREEHTRGGLRQVDAGVACVALG